MSSLVMNLIQRVTQSEELKLEWINFQGIPVVTTGELTNKFVEYGSTRITQDEAEELLR